MMRPATVGPTAGRERDDHAEQAHRASRACSIGEGEHEHGHNHRHEDACARRLQQTAGEQHRETTAPKPASRRA